MLFVSYFPWCVSVNLADFKAKLCYCFKYAACNSFMFSLAVYTTTNPGLLVKSTISRSCNFKHNFKFYWFHTGRRWSGRSQRKGFLRAGTQITRVVIKLIDKWTDWSSRRKMERNEEGLLLCVYLCLLVTDKIIVFTFLHRNVMPIS